MYDTIVVPTDGSEHAVRAAEHALKIADAFDATVHLISVVDVQGTAGLFDAGGVDETFVDRLEDAGWELIRETEERSGAPDDVRTAVVKNTPAGGILDYADEYDAELVVMGTRGRSGLHRFVSGSVTEKVLRLADVPVLTVRATEGSALDDGYERVLIPTDGSECAAAAIDHGVAIADAFDATVHSLNVVDVGAIATASDIAPAAETLERLESLGEDATDEVAERAREVGLDAVTAVREGFPAQTIVEYAEENDVDLVAMGTHGRGGFERFLLGSTTEKVVRRVETPVLSVREQEE